MLNRYLAYKKTHFILSVLVTSCVAVANAHATSFDLQVNHGIKYYGNPQSNPQDGPVGGRYTFIASAGINDIVGVVNNAELLKDLPDDAIYLGYTAPQGVICTNTPNIGDLVGNRIIQCIFPTLSVGAPQDIDFNVILPNEALTNRSTVSLTAPGNSDGNQSNHDAIARDITTHKRADLAVKISGPANQSEHEQGAIVDYLLQVRNTNEDYAYPLLAGEKAVVRFPLPAGTAWQNSPTGAGWSCSPGMDGSANPPVAVQNCEYTAPSGGVAKNTPLPLLTIPVTISANSGNSDALVSVAGHTTGGASFIDAYPDNNSDQVNIKFKPNTQLDMILNKTVTPTTLDSLGAATQSVDYTFKVTRNSGGMVPSAPFTITDDLPAGVQYGALTTEALAAGWTCAATGQKLTCGFTGTVNADASLPDLVFNANVNISSFTIDPSTGTSLVKNTAKLTVFNEPLVNVNNNSSTATFTISNKASLKVNKAARASATGDTAVGAIKNGTEFFWRVLVENDGLVNVRNGDKITVTDVLDSKLEYVKDAAENPWACSVNPAVWTASTPQTVICSLSSGINKKSRSNLNIKVKAHFSGADIWNTVENQASVSCPTNRYCGPINILTNKATVNLSEKVADLSIEKSAAISPGSSTYAINASGSEVVYTLKVKNALPTPIPAGMVAADFQKAKTVTVTDEINNLLFASSPIHPVTGTPKYSNDRFLEAEIQPLSNGVTGTCDYGDVASALVSKVRVTCTLNDVPVSNDEYVIKIKARQFVDPESPSELRTITNTATVHSVDTAEHNPDNNEASDSVTLKALTNLIATKTAAPISALAGQVIVYRLEATNQGPSKATAMTLVDTLPVGMIWVTKPDRVSCTLSGGGSFDAGQVVTEATKTMTCPWSGEADVATNTLTYEMRSVSTGYPASVTNNVFVKTDTQETIPLTDPATDNKSSQTITLSPAQLDVRITMDHSADRLPINKGVASRTEYVIKVVNSGNSTSYATNVKVVDSFPAPGSTATFVKNGAVVTSVKTISSSGIEIKPSRFAASNCQFNSSGLQCDLPWLAPGEGAEITFEMDATAIDNKGLPYGTILHAARVSADGEFLPNLPAGADVEDNNTTKDRTSAYDAATSFDPTQWPTLVDLVIKKTSTSNNVKIGDSINYRINVRNAENATPPNHLISGNAKVTDVLPVGLSLVGSAPNGCNYVSVNRTLQCTIENLQQGASIDFDFTVKVDSLAYGQTRIINRASVQLDQDPDPSNNESEVPVTSIPPTNNIQSIPTLSEWGMIFLSLLLSFFAVRRIQVKNS